MMLARFLRFLTRFPRAQTRVGRAHAVVLRRSRGHIQRSLLLAGGQPVLALTTTGRRSGTPRSTVVAYVQAEHAYAVAALNLGSDRNPGWCLNLLSDPRAWIEVNGEHKAVQAHRANGEEAHRLWQAFIDRLPAISKSLRLARREVPMFVLEPAAQSGPGYTVPANAASTTACAVGP